MLSTYLLKVSLLLGALTLAYRWLIQFETFSQLNRVLLWLNMLAAWSLPLIPLGDWGPLAVQQQFHEVASVQMVSALIEPATNNPQTGPLTADSVESSPVTLVQTIRAWGAAEWFLLIYWLGVAGFMFRFLYHLARLAISLRKYPAKRLNSGLWLVQDATVDSPFSFFNLVVCDPARHSPAELRHIFAHETEHARGGHSFDLLLAEMQRILLWFNPFAWVHQRLVQGNLEYLADRAVLQVGFAKKQYQMSLVNAAVQCQELPLTNSFAQSLLKNRIKMMNRKPSQIWVLGKYAALIAVLYLSSAFVAPYRQQIIDLSPSITQPIVRALVEETVSTKKSEEVVNPIIEVPTLEKTAEVVLPFKVDTVFVPKSKWVQMKGDTMYWVIPATVTWDELLKIKQDIESLGYVMSINTLRYDPLQKFLTAIDVRMYKPDGGGCEGGREEDIYTPIRGYSGFLMKHTRSIEQLPPEPLLSKYNESYQKALVLRKENELEYMEDKLDKELYTKTKGMATVYDTKKGLQKMKRGDVGKGDLDGVRRSSDNNLEILEKYKSSEFFINGKPATLKEMNEVPFDKIEKINLAQNFRESRFIMVFIR